MAHAEGKVAGAAIASAGVVLRRNSLTCGALKGGALVAPFDLALRMARNYRIVCPKGCETKPQVSAFIDWILAQT